MIYRHAEQVHLFKCSAPESLVFVREHLKSWMIRVQVRNVSAQRSLVGMAHLLQIGCRNSNLCKTRLK